MEAGTVEEMQAEDAANGFFALGNASRLRIFRLLVQAGRQGAPISHIHTHLGIPLSTLAHHLGALVKAGLVTQHKNGRQVMCRADFDRMDGLIAYLTENCCAGVETCETHPDSAAARHKEHVHA